MPIGREDARGWERADTEVVDLSLSLSCAEGVRGLRRERERLFLRIITMRRRRVIRGISRERIIPECDYKVWVYANGEVFTLRALFFENASFFRKRVVYIIPPKV